MFGAAERRDPVRLVRPIDVEVDVRHEAPVQRESADTDVARATSAPSAGISIVPMALSDAPFDRAFRECGCTKRQEERRHHRKSQSVELHQSLQAHESMFTVSGRLAEQTGNLKYAPSF